MAAEHWENVCVPVISDKKKGDDSGEATMKLLTRPASPLVSLMRVPSGNSTQEWLPFLTMVDLSYWHTDFLNV